MSSSKSKLTTVSNDFVKHIGESVTLTVASKSSDSEQKHVDGMYNVLLSDILKVLNMHGGVNGITKQYKLCPRWELGNNKRRDILVEGIKPSENGFVGDREELGTIRITHDSAQNVEKDGYTHRQFELGFERNQNGFITASEFYDLYKNEL